MALKVGTIDADTLEAEDAQRLVTLCEGTPNPFTAEHIEAASQQDWVLCTLAHDGEELVGAVFSTLERVGGTPAVLLGLASLVQDERQREVFESLMSEIYHRALMAFPDEDVLFGAQFNSVGGFAAYSELSELIPRPDYKPTGEERAWGRRLAKRFGAGASRYNDRAFHAKGKATQAVVFDTALTEGLEELEVLFEGHDLANGDTLITHGWISPEKLVVLGSEPSE